MRTHSLLNASQESRSLAESGDGGEGGVGGCSREVQERSSHLGEQKSELSRELQDDYRAALIAPFRAAIMTLGSTVVCFFSSCAQLCSMCVCVGNSRDLDLARIMHNF